ncbi:MAG: DUF262 domain-containing protein [Bythopirellula sp.]|nr:DUF262 domain-containing protein [Bythopirellula sp.]
MSIGEHQERKIEVRPGQLGNLIVYVQEGQYRVPQFQRNYVWPKTKVRDLFDSIYQEFPIGSFFLWSADRQFNHLFRNVLDIGVRPVGPNDSVSFILDGQQRITSLFAALKGLTIARPHGENVDFRTIVFDLQDEKFRIRKADDKRYVAVADIWNKNPFELAKRIDEAYAPALERCWTTLKTYPISIVEVRDKDLHDVCQIFQRINQGGKRLDRFDLVAAMTFTDDFDLREQFQTDILKPLKEKKFGGIKPAVVTQLLALCQSGQCSERHEFALTTEQVQSLWPKAVSGIMLAADTLRSNMGVTNEGYLPYDAILTLLAYYFAKSRNRALPVEHMKWVKRWFWRAAFGQHYGSGGATTIARDRELLDQLIANESAQLEIPVNLTVDDLQKIKMTQTSSALRNAFLCLLALQRPSHLKNNGTLDLLNNISGFTSPEKHHIFPQAYLRKSFPDAAVHALPNFCFLPAELNKKILDQQPSNYVSELQRENPDFEKAARSHLIPLSADSGLFDNDYKKFLQQRGELILAEIHRLCGDVSTPRLEERQQFIEQLENRIRSCIHEVLLSNAGNAFGKTNIPPDIRKNVEERIEQDLAKHPDLQRDQIGSIRRKLDYVNVMEYLNIILNGANWAYFEPTFRRKQDLQNHFAMLNDYRNNVMHGRPMTELTRLGGETAMLWFESVLPSGA